MEYDFEAAAKLRSDLLSVPVGLMRRPTLFERILAALPGKSRKQVRLRSWLARIARIDANAKLVKNGRDAIR